MCAVCSERPVARISQGGFRFEAVGGCGSRGLGAQPPDADDYLVTDFLQLA